MPNIHLTVAAIIEKNARFLLVEELINGQPVINQPAGHVEIDESITAAIIRETLEETAWHFKPEHLVGIYRWVHPSNGEVFIRHAYAGNVYKHEPELPLDKEIIRTVWLSREELESNLARLRSPLVLKCIEDYVNGQSYPLSLYQDIS